MNKEEIADNLLKNRSWQKIRDLKDDLNRIRENGLLNVSQEDWEIIKFIFAYIGGEICRQDISSMNLEFEFELKTLEEIQGKIEDIEESELSTINKEKEIEKLLRMADGILKEAKEREAEEREEE